MIYQRVKVYSRAAALLLSVCLAAALPASAQTPKPDLPDPVKFVNKFDIVWRVVRSVLVDQGFSIELEDRSSGRIVTKPYEFITGALTSSEVDKVAIKSDTITGSWLKGRYSVEVLMEIVTPVETIVTVHTKMEALNRDIDGSEKWMPLQSLGVFEKRILGKISMKLLGNELDFDQKKGFWDRTPEPVDPRKPKPIPTRPPEN